MSDERKIVEKVLGEGCGRRGRKEGGEIGEVPLYDT
jgi:hypothetical protein